MKEMDMKYLAVFPVYPAKKIDIKPDDIKGGSLQISKETKSIFLSSFNGQLKVGLKHQPFNFAFEGDDRNNLMRNEVIEFFKAKDIAEKNEISKRLAYRLAKLIDTRIKAKALLFTIAHGQLRKQQRIAIWLYPHDDPIQIKFKQGVPNVSEIKNAFSKSSLLRKACFFEAPIKITRTDLLKGILLDSTASIDKIASDYWLTKFLQGEIGLSSERGTKQLIKGIRSAQARANTIDEKNSVKAAFYSLRSKRRKVTTINQIGNMLLGGAKQGFDKTIPRNIENDARFNKDFEQIARKIQSSNFVLKSGIEIHFPYKIDVDPDDYITEEDGKRMMNIKEEINEEFFS